MSYYDTSKDPRILFIEMIINDALEYFKSRKIPHIRREKIIELMNNIAETIKKIKWSYIAPKEVENQGLLDSLDEHIKNLRDLIVPIMDKLEDPIRKKIRYVIKIVSTFRDRFVNQTLDISNIVPTVYIKIMSIEKHPSAKNLYVSWVSDGSETYQIVTNDATLKPNDVVPLAFLPPKEFMGIISEGMFIGGEKGIKRTISEKIGEHPDLDEKEKNKLKAEIIAAIKTYKSKR